MLGKRGSAVGKGKARRQSLEAEVQVATRSAAGESAASLVVTLSKVALRVNGSAATKLDSLKKPVLIDVGQSGELTRFRFAPTVRVGDSRLANDVRRYLDHADPHVRASAASALRRMATEHLGWLGERLQQEKIASVRLAVVRALGILEQALCDAAPVAMAAVESLSCVGGAEAVVLPCL